MTALQAYLLGFVSAFLAATILPIYSEVVLGGVASYVDIDMGIMIAVMTVGNVLGAVVNWVIGRWLLHYQDRSWFPFKPAQLERVSRWFNRWGVWSLLLAWTPFIGDPLTFVAGLMRVPILPFLVLVTIGKAARYAAIGYGVAYLW